MINTNKTIKIYSKEMTTKDGTRKFLVHSTKLNDEYFEVKFAQTAIYKPTTTGYSDVTVTKYFVKNNGDFNRILYICGSSNVSKSELIEEEIM